MSIEYFVVPQTTHIPILEGQEWIEVKQELTAGEQRRLIGAALRSARSVTNVEGQELVYETDFENAALTKVALYLVEWSLPRDIGTPKAKLEALRNLKGDVFAAIDAAVERHAAGPEKKAPTNAPPSAPAS